jgi:L-arabinose isomerase
MAIPSTRPRVVVVSSYFALLEQGMGPDFRAQRMECRRLVSEEIASFADVVTEVLVDSGEAAVSAADQLDHAQADAVVIAPTMATPPEWLTTVVRKRSDLPVFLLAVRERDEVPDDYDTEQGTSLSLLVGITMIYNAFLREQRGVTLVMGTQGDPSWCSHLAVALLAAGGAGAVRRARLLVGGAPIEGYSDVAVTTEDLRRLGVEIVSFDDDELSSQMTAVSPEAVQEMIRWTASVGEVEVDSKVLARSATLACALHRMVDEYDVDGGSFNCHGSVFRDSERVGITACLAVTSLAAANRMFSCTGDIPVAILLLLGRYLAGGALYCELYAVDRPGNWILVANGGEGDLALSVPGTTRFLPEDHYLGRRGPGVATAFDVSSGPATLAALTPLPATVGGWRLIIMQGDVVGSRHRAMEGPNAMFTPLGVAALEAFAAWTVAGAPHHAALVPGHWAGVLADVAGHLGIDCVTIDGARD